VSSLFIRIFLWFWAATVLLAAVLVGTVYVTEPYTPPPHWFSLTHRLLQLYGHNVATAYDHHGCTAVDMVLKRDNPFPDFEGRRALADPSGVNLCGPALNSASVDLARQAFSSKAGFFRRGEHTGITATPVLGPSGRKYVLLFEMPPMRHRPFALSPRIWAIRILALLITAGLVCYALSRYFAFPVRRLRGVAQRFALGDLKARVGNDPLLKRRDEVAELAKEFDEMASRIESLITRQEEMLLSQRRLLGDISHELRSPLTRLALASGLLQRRVGDETKPLLQRIDRECDRLNTMIGQLLTLARLDIAPAPEATETVDLKKLLENIISDAAFELSSRDVHIQLSAPVSCCLEATPELLYSAFENVVRNAVRYTKEGTTILVDLACANRLISVTVSDQGPGVPEKDLAHLFEPFYRVAEARDRKSGGSGLGLAITERTVRLHGGTVEAFNRPKGGLSVCISFPVKPGAIRQPSLVSASGDSYSLL
jgi:two-component system, OmpR family, sensor histidine kinase CpxA